MMQGGHWTMLQTEIIVTPSRANFLFWSLTS